MALSMKLGGADEARVLGGRGARCGLDDLRLLGQCAGCTATIANGDVCSVTGMTCGDCACEQTWQPGGERAWSFACIDQ
jgi:hypothetical protein